MPAVCLGDRCVPGGDLGAIAELLSLDYTAPRVLPSDQLFTKFTAVLDAASRFFLQAPFEGLAYKSPDRDRPFRNLGWHITLIPRAFVIAYDTGVFDSRSFREANVSPLLTGADIAAELKRSQAVLREWWQTSGGEDPMDRVIESYWGMHTLEEVFERETWHSAQHTRQVMMFLEQLRIAPDGPLTSELLAGLPMPERVWD
ncbi:MAG TPA: DinB family protein [Dehalococcoidia bacterium]|nr:DinB family protein [Dehalococcoidia bacterium]